MKIIIERKWKKAEYTIGVLWIDGERICNTLEPVDRGLENNATIGSIAKKEWKESERDALATKALYAPGTTAIPTGYYRVLAKMSGKFHSKRLFMDNVPGFTGIMIHEGNTRKDTRGCILVGENNVCGRVSNSCYWLKKINDRVFDALKRGNYVTLWVTGSSL